MQKFSYNGNVQYEIFRKGLLFKNEILKGFGIGFKIIYVALMQGCESNRLYGKAIPDTQ